MWVTGASSGIGEALAKQLATAGHTVIATARNQDKLQQLQRTLGNNVVPLAADLLDTQHLDRLEKAINTQFTGIDRAIFCAGSCEYFDVDEPEWAQLTRLMEINFQTTVNSLRCCLSLLKSAPLGRGHLMIVGSQASRVPFPKTEGYGASKAALDYLAASLSVDLKHSGVDVTSIQPGFVDTPLTRRNTFPMPFLMSADEAASIIIEKMAHRPMRIRFPTRLNLALRAGELFPRLWHFWASKQAKSSASAGESGA